MVHHYEENAMLMPGVGSSGMFGSLQGMVQSFSTERTSDMFMYSGGTSLLPCVNGEFHPSSRGECSRQTIAHSDIEGSPERGVVDESGYDSSESSVYEVASDDENYGKDSNIFGDDEVA
ncbi:unnamed protein product, partial [Urochloa humidicola]